MNYNSQQTINLGKFMGKLGISKVETDLYIKLLESGPLTFTNLSKNTGIPRSTVYLNIEKLIDKGMVTEITKNNGKYLVPESPQKLKLLIENRKITLAQNSHELKELEGNFTNLIKQIHKLGTGDNSLEVSTEYYEGKKDIKLIYQEAFLAKELRSYVSLGELDLTRQVFHDDILLLYYQCTQSNTVYE